MPESRFPPIAYLLVLIAAVMIYGIILLPGSTFAGMDFLNLNYPRVVLTGQSWATGRVPLWNWYEWGGAPLLAALQGAVFYPPTWLALLLPLPYGLQVFVFCHLLAAGIGAALLAQRVFRLSPAAACFAAVAYMGNAFFVGRMEQFQIIAVNCLLPWLMLSIYQTVFQRRFSAGLGMIWALNLLAGHPQFAALNLIGAFAFVTLALLVQPRRNGFFRVMPWRRSARVAGQLIFQIGTGTALAALQLLPTWELGKLSERIWPYPESTTPELVWNNLPALIFPHYYNHVTGLVGRVMDYTELGLYAGVLTVPLALIALGVMAQGYMKRGRPRPAGNRRLHALLVSCLGVWLLAMWFALGRQGGLATLVFDHAPFFRQSRGAARSLNVAALMLSILAGTGFHLCLNRWRHSRLAPSLTTARTSSLLAGAVCLAAAGGLAVNHLPALRSILVPSNTLNARSLLPSEIRTDMTDHGGRIYRFMAMDSDIYLNNSPSAVAERVVRLQPNMASLAHLALVDGYEEGLLPTRNRANLLRRFNRNLRGPVPDAALLSALGSNTMLTEYPLDSGMKAWQTVSQEFPRPSVVPPTQAGAPATYRFWRSSYPTALAYSLDRLFPDSAEQSAFLATAAQDFPSPTILRDQPASEIRDHAFSHITASQFHLAALHNGMTDKPWQWNRLLVTPDAGTSEALLFIPPYPGWKVEKKNEAQANLIPTNALFYVLRLDYQASHSTPLELIYAPFSFKLGLFITLSSCLLTFIVCPPRWLRNNHHKIKGEWR